jgi:hypothetical protein
LLRPWRTVLGGFEVQPGATARLPARPAIGAFVKLRAPTAVALRGDDLLIVDVGSARIWRADLALNTLSPIAGAPATPSTMVVLGPDLSAWVLDGVTRQVLRFARDGRLLQTYRIADAALSPVAIALADAGATLLVGDDSRRQWVEFRGVGMFSIAVRPRRTDGGGVTGVDALSTNGDTVYVLDRNAAAVHVVRRDGQILASLGEDELKQAVALAADRFGRIFVHDEQDRAIKLFSLGRPSQIFKAVQLQVLQIGGIAIDERLLAVADRLTGQVMLFVVQESQQP